MAEFTDLTENFLAYWYIVIPELLYAVFAGFCFFGPGGLLGLTLYAAAFFFAPEGAMAVMGAVMAVHLVLVLLKSAAGDIFSGSKKADEAEEYKGVPKLSGDSGDIQKALDRNKESSGKIDKTC